MDQKNYFPVVYLRNGDACVGKPCETEEECRNELIRAVRLYPDKVESTTYMIRAEADVKSIFGKPKSRDVVKEALR